MTNINFLLLSLLATASNCCKWEADYGAEDPNCDDDEDVGGLEECSVLFCFSLVEDFTKTECVATDLTSGQVTSIDIGIEKGVRFFASDSSQLAEYEVTVNDNNGKDAVTTITGQGKSGPAALCWMEKYTNKQIVRIMLDNKGQLRVYGLKGGLKLTQFKETTGTEDGDFCGMEYTFTSDKLGDFCYIDPGLLTPVDFMNQFIL